MIGRSDLLDTKKAIDHYKVRGLDFSNIFHRPDAGPGVGRCAKYATKSTALSQSLDMTKLLPACMPALEHGESVSLELPIRNVNRTVGTILGSELTRRHGGAGLPDDTIQLAFNGDRWPELWGVSAAGNHDDSGRRRQRLHR